MREEVQEEGKAKKKTIQMKKKHNMRDTLGLGTTERNSLKAWGSSILQKLLELAPSLTFFHFTLETKALGLAYIPLLLVLLGGCLHKFHGSRTQVFQKLM